MDLVLTLMHRESEILVRVLEEMKARGMVALGLHDGLLLPRSRAEEGRMMMEVVSREFTPAGIPVTMSWPSPPPPSTYKTRKASRPRKDLDPLGNAHAGVCAVRRGGGDHCISVKR